MKGICSELESGMVRSTSPLTVLSAIPLCVLAQVQTALPTGGVAPRFRTNRGVVVQSGDDQAYPACASR